MSFFKILLTGGAGFIGSHTAEKLIKYNHKVIIVDNLSSGEFKNISGLSGIKFYKKDILNDDLSQIFENEKPDYVIHLAAQTSVANSVAFPDIDAQLNIVATIKLLQLCKKYNVKKILTASTAAVYGNSKYLPIDENHPIKPFSPYGLSKYTMEKYIKLSKVPYIIFRFSNVYGPRQKSCHESGVISIFSNQMKKKISSTKIGGGCAIYGSGEQVRDFLYVEDVAQIFALAIESNLENEILNYSTNKGVTINNLYKIMSEIYSYKIPPIYLPKKDEDIAISILSNEKIKSKLHLSGYCFTSLEEGLNKLRKYD